MGVVTHTTIMSTAATTMHWNAGPRCRVTPATTKTTAAKRHQHHDLDSASICYTSHWRRTWEVAVEVPVEPHVYEQPEREGYDGPECQQQLQYGVANDNAGLLLRLELPGHKQHRDC